MASKIPDEGGLQVLGALFSVNPKMTSFTLQLLTVMSALSDDDSVAMHSVATGGGYEDKILANDATLSLVAGIPQASWAAQEWTFTGPLTTNPNIIGYRILFGSTVLCEETLAAAITPTTNGDKFRLTPTYAFGNGTPT